jgi:hypothetical protein
MQASTSYEDVQHEGQLAGFETQLASKLASTGQYSPSLAVQLAADKHWSDFTDGVSNLDAGDADMLNGIATPLADDDLGGLLTPNSDLDVAMGIAGLAATAPDGAGVDEATLIQSGGPAVAAELAAVERATPTTAGGGRARVPTAWSVGAVGAAAAFVAVALLLAARKRISQRSGPLQTPSADHLALEVSHL